jgi:hypothetical protein
MRLNPGRKDKQTVGSVGVRNGNQGALDVDGDGEASQ